MHSPIPFRLFIPDITSPSPALACKAEQGKAKRVAESPPEGPNPAGVTVGDSASFERKVSDSLLLMLPFPLLDMTVYFSDMPQVLPEYVKVNVLTF